MEAANKSKDGIHRISVRVEHRLAYEDIVNCIALLVRNGILPKEGDVSFGKVEEEIRTQLLNDAQTMHYWSDNIWDANERQAIEDRAQFIAERYFSRLFPDQARMTA